MTKIILHASCSHYIPYKIRDRLRGRAWHSMITKKNACIGLTQSHTITHIARYRYMCLTTHMTNNNYTFEMTQQKKKEKKRQYKKCSATTKA